MLFIIFGRNIFFDFLNFSFGFKTDRPGHRVKEFIKNYPVLVHLKNAMNEFRKLKADSRSVHNIQKTFLNF